MKQLMCQTKNKLLFVFAGADSNFTVHEDFIGLKPVVWTTSDEIVEGNQGKIFMWQELKIIYTIYKNNILF